VVYGAWATLLYLPARLARLLRRLRELPRLRETARSRVFVESQAALSRSGGNLGRAELLFLRRLLARGGILVADVMTPWARVDSVESSLPLPEARERVRSSQHSRLPVVDGTQITGLLTVKDLLGAHKAGENGRTVDDLRRSVYFVRQEVTLDRLLEELRGARVHLAVVLDRLGRPAGLVTMEDVLEQIVGELHDERERE
jgi:CBS domain containing-hemolysin-like protein